MIRLAEDLTKERLRARGLPVPRGRVADSPDEARRAAAALGGRTVVKALVTAGRRGRAGAVIGAEDPEEASAAARRLIGATLDGFEVQRVYVEEKVAIARELYLSFGFDERGPRVVLGGRGGVEIEDVYAGDPAAVATRALDARRGLPATEAEGLWEQAGVDDGMRAALGALTAALATVFREEDAALLELNPMAVTPGGDIRLVGAMMGLDPLAAFRHPEWQEHLTGAPSAGPGERAVEAANRRFPGGAVRYTELDGDIGLLVGGGGTGMLVHDLILERGGRPANHADSSPGPITEKLTVLLEAVFDNPRTRSLLICYNRLQMARCDVKIEALLAALEGRPVDTGDFPIVVRLVGPQEGRARELAARVPGLRYLPSAATIEDAVDLVVRLTTSAGEREP